MKKTPNVVQNQLRGVGGCERAVRLPRALPERDVNDRRRPAGGPRERERDSPLCLNPMMDFPDTSLSFRGRVKFALEDLREFPGCVDTGGERKELR